jgi:hypothetical protein
LGQNGKIISGSTRFTKTGLKEKARKQKARMYENLMTIRNILLLTSKNVTTQWNIKSGMNDDPIESILVQKSAASALPLAGIDSHLQYASDQTTTERRNKIKSLLSFSLHPCIKTINPNVKGTTAFTNPENASADCNGCICINYNT